MSNSEPIWRSRGYVPHVEIPHALQMITFRLHDSFPLTRRAEWEAMLAIEHEVRRHRQLEAYLDAGLGECLLARPEIAGLVQSALIFFDSERYHLLAWVVMPNHVHVLIETIPTHPLEKVVASWKSYTAHEANRILGRTGQFWQREYFDRYIRNQDHLTAAVNYIHGNPVQAGLVATVEEWEWSSANPRWARP